MKLADPDVEMEGSNFAKVFIIHPQTIFFGLFPYLLSIYPIQGLDFFSFSSFLIFIF